MVPVLAGARIYAFVRGAFFIGCSFFGDSDIASCGIGVRILQYDFK